MAAAVASNPDQWRAKKRNIFHSVFQTAIPQPTPQSAPPFTSIPDEHPVFGVSARPVFSAAAGLHSSTYASTIPATSFLAAAPSTQQPPLFSHHIHGEAAAHDQLRFDRAWHTVTSRIVLPSSATAEDSFGTLPPDSQFHSQDEEAEFNAALRLILFPRRFLPQAARTENLVAWHSQQVRRHFVQHVIPLMSALSGSLPHGGPGGDLYDEHMVIVQSTVQTLEAALRQYFYCLHLITRGLQREDEDGARTADITARRFRRDIHALVSNSASPTLMSSLRIVLEGLVGKILQLPRQKKTEPGRQRSEGIVADAARRRLLELVQSLHDVGLAGERFQILFAEIMDWMMSEFVQRFARVWENTNKRRPEAHGFDMDAAKSMSITSPSWCIMSLCDWIENHYARLALEVLSRIDEAGSSQQGVTMSDVKKWKEIGIGRLATLRISELFDIVLQWPSSKGALDDLRASIDSPRRRSQLAEAFSATLQKRLLHPARSTLEILQVYISMIRTFHALDQSKVLLGRVVPPLQMYLCQRDDAVRTVVTGLLASPEEVKQAQMPSPSTLSSKAISGAASENSSGKLIELAVLLNDPAQHRRGDGDEDHLDWDDMDWQPDPVDAGANYKRPKTEDVIGTLISALGAPDVFIKEFQNMLSERLLSGRTNFEQEQKVLGLLRKRFGDSALQNCDVMIKDILDSRHADTMIRRRLLGQPPEPQRSFGGTPTQPSYLKMGTQLDVDEARSGQVPYHARILSRLYWPNVVQDPFKLPKPVEKQQQKYDKGYETLKKARKLTWLHQLGQATVELELQDRTINAECKTYEAAVIYAFQEGSEAAAENKESEPARRTADELQEELGMDEELVFQALDFWESQGVLSHVSTSPDTYVVIETAAAARPARPPLHPAASAPAVLLDTEQQQLQQQQPTRKPPPQRAGTTGAMDAKEKEKRDLYWSFIKGMLTNSSAQMPLSQIAMMMKMMVAGGFSWSNEELQEFLGDKVAAGELDVAGGKYRLVKK